MPAPAGRGPQGVRDHEDDEHTEADEAIATKRSDVAAGTAAPAGEDRSDREVPETDDERKPEDPTDLDARSWKYVLRKTLHELTDDKVPDLAAALTYYAVLSIFPAALALVSLLGVVGQGQQSVDTVLRVMSPLVSEEMLGTVGPALTQIAESDAAGFALVTGLLAALWTASGYVGAFARAMNQIYEVEEGRPFWKLRPIMMGLTLVAVLLSAMVLLMLIVSGPLAESIGDVLGLGGVAVTTWSIVKWPILAVFVVLVVAVLYYATPNVQQPKFRWISVGAAVAIVIWVLASVAFSFYVANFGSYNRTYGSLAGVVVALLFLWITNLALLFGAELDAELERGRQLEAGIVAEHDIQLPVRDDRNIHKSREQRAEDVARGRQIRQAADREDDRDDVHDQRSEMEHKEEQR